MKKTIAFFTAALLLTAGARADFTDGAENLGYNRERAAAYVLKFAQTPNPAYADYSGYGGDCTNFVSQVLHAGGMPMTSPLRSPPLSSWYYYSPNWGMGRSATWTSAQAFSGYWAGAKHRANACKIYLAADFNEIEKWQEISGFIELGDVVQYASPLSGAAYHSQAVCSITTAEISVGQHTANGFRSLRTYACALPPDTSISLIKIKKPGARSQTGFREVTSTDCEISKTALLEFVEIRIEHNSHIINSILQGSTTCDGGTQDELVTKCQLEIAELEAFRARVEASDCSCAASINSLWQEYWCEIVCQPAPSNYR